LNLDRLVFALFPTLLPTVWIEFAKYLIILSVICRFWSFPFRIHLVSGLRPKPISWLKKMGVNMTGRLVRTRTVHPIHPGETPECNLRYYMISLKLDIYGRNVLTMKFSTFSFSNLLHRPFWVKTIIGSLCIVSIALTIALTVVIVLYLKTFGKLNYLSFSFNRFSLAMFTLNWIFKCS